MNGYPLYSTLGVGREVASYRGRLRQALRHVGVSPIMLLGFLAELGWAFVGSLGLRLGVSASVGLPQVYLWLGGAVMIAALTAVAAILARPPTPKED